MVSAPSSSLPSPKFRLWAATHLTWSRLHFRTSMRPHRAHRQFRWTSRPRFPAGSLWIFLSCYRWSFSWRHLFWPRAAVRTLTLGCICDVWPRSGSHQLMLLRSCKGLGWSLWEILWLVSSVFVSMFFILPETSSTNILLRRAARLRKLTGNPNLKSQVETDQAQLKVTKVVHEPLYRPMQIMFFDPAVSSQSFTSVDSILANMIKVLFPWI